jgi:hypothetical protein
MASTHGWQGDPQTLQRAAAPEAPQDPAEQDTPAERQARIDAEYNAKVRAIWANRLHQTLCERDQARASAEGLAEALRDIKEAAINPQNVKGHVLARIEGVAEAALAQFEKGTR